MGATSGLNWPFAKAPAAAFSFVFLLNLYSHGCCYDRCVGAAADHNVQLALELQGHFILLQVIVVTGGGRRERRPDRTGGPGQIHRS
jgi:hypothetical protein